jgi:hypothetical protein
MTTPSKEQVRTWMRQQIAKRCPPPSPEQIRRELGWNLIAAERKAA